MTFSTPVSTPFSTPVSSHRALRGLTLGLTLAAAAALSFAAPADAAAPTRIDAEYWGVSCVAALGDGQTLFLFGSGTTDGSEGGVGAFVEDADGQVVADGQAESFAFGDGFRAEVPLAGTVLSIAAATRITDRVTGQVDERDGNRWTKGTTTRAEIVLDGVQARYGGRDLVLPEDTCVGDLNAFSVRTTNPAATVTRYQDFDSEICDLDGLTDGQVRLSGVLPDVYVEVVLDHGGEDVEKAQGELRLRGGRGTLTTEVRDLYAGSVRTTARVDLVLTKSASRTREVVAEGGSTETRTVTPYRQEITVAFADGRRGTATCTGVAVTTQVRTAPAG